MTEDDVNRATVRVTETVGEIQGVDGRKYDLREGDVVTLPDKNADALVSKGAAETVTDADPDGLHRDPDDVHFDGPPEPVVTNDGTTKFVYVTTEQPGDRTRIDTVELGTLECTRCGSTVDCSVSDGDIDDPHECPGCERQGPFTHVGDVNPEDVEIALRAGDTWNPPSGVSPDGFADLWDDTRRYLYDHWDAGTGDDVDAVYAGLTAYVLSTWVRENLTFVPHLMLMGKTTGGKTRLLNTFAQVSYRAIVTASATPASMFRLIDGYDVSYYISEYHGLDPDSRRELDNIVRAGQKRGEKVTRAEPTSTGHEPRVFDPFSHVAVATQYTPDDDIVNRCIQVQSSTPNRDMPATLDEARGSDLRDRLLFARYRLLSPDGCDECDEWDVAEAAAYDYLDEQNITGRTREKLLGLLTVAYVWDRVDEFAPFVEAVVEQDREAAAESEDAFVVKAIRDAAHERVREVTTLGSDPYSAVTIPYETDDGDECEGIAGRYENMTGQETSASWVGHVVKRLGFEKEAPGTGPLSPTPTSGRNFETSVPTSMSSGDPTVCLRPKP